MHLHHSQHQTHARRRIAALTALALAASLLATPTLGAVAKPPPNPSDQQINSVAQQKATLADEVGRIAGQVAAMQNQLDRLRANRELAEQKMAYALSLLEQASQRATTARDNVHRAQRRVDAAQVHFRSFVSSTYMSGDLGGTAGTLLTAPDPNVLLQQSALQQYESSHQMDAIANLQSAGVAKSNADAAARAAVEARKLASDAAKKAKKEADAAVQAATQQERQLQSSLANSQAQLVQAQEQLATLNHQRAAFVAYQQRQAAIRAARERARLAAIARAKRLAAERAAAFARQQAADRAQQRQQQSGGSPGGSPSGGSSGGGSSGGGSTAPTPTGGGWSAAKGQDAVNRAEHYLGWMYAWAGGNAGGPTYGVCTGGGAENDCHVLGFDCSGLTLYAWAPYLSLPHFSVTQYYAAGSYHPDVGSLMPGDLVFWSSDGSLGAVHHVAMYVGGGNVIQAPQSGDVIQITPLGSVSYGYYGATRPLT